jgi:undecaprenyl-diphosphatase
MELWQGVLLGLVQGLTEFLPVSSSGHLALAEFLFGVDVDKFLSFDIVAHFATLLAVFTYFAKDLRRLIPGREPLEEDWYVRISGGGKAYYFYLLIVATLVPLVIVYVLWHKDITALRTEPYAVAGGFLYGGFILILSDFLSFRAKNKGVGLGIMDALLIGLAQAVALAPGVSRAGATIATGRILGLTKEAAFRFSFFMAIPAIGGAVLLHLKDISAFGNTGALILGGIAAFLSGLAALAILRRVMEKTGLTIFGVYCVLAGIVTIIIRAYHT